MQRLLIIAQYVEQIEPWLFRLGIYLSNNLIDDPVILAFMFC